MEKVPTLSKKIESEKPPRGIEKEKISGSFKKLFERVCVLSEEIKKNIFNATSQLNHTERIYIPPKKVPPTHPKDVLILSADAQKQIREKIKDGTFKLAQSEKQRSEIVEKTENAISETIGRLNERRCTDASERGVEIPEYVHRALAQQRAIRQARSPRSGSISLKI